ncbi:hypothetical protein CRUP_025484 [Coryphaenoides rupestris]|nr:hypothetical protein CRUP_025484 [Coryphaenoides rupestris]
MPYIDPQVKFGVNVDRWLVLQSSQQPRQRAARCHAFEKELHKRLTAIQEQRAKMEKEKTYVAPLHHTGQATSTP